MPYSLIPDLVAPSQAQGKHILSSFDSSREFSLVHWLEVRRLVALEERDERESKGYVFDDSLLVSQ